MAAYVRRELLTAAQRAELLALPIHDSVRNAAIQAGAIAYFVKPFSDDAFLPPCIKP
jgi:hypothetical protein